MGELSENRRWFGVKTQPRKELLAELHLKRQGYITYLPRIVVPGSPGRRGVVPARAASFGPFFPGYLFVELNLAREGWRSINGTVGVSRLVQFGRDPSPVPSGLVEDLIERTDANGVLGFEDALSPGDKVRIVGGGFDGLIGELVSLDGVGRVGVLMDLMSRKVIVEADRRGVVRAD